MTSTTRDPRRIEAARHAFTVRHLRRACSVAPQPYLRSSILAGVRAGLTVAIALPLVALSPHPELIGYAALGALPALFGRFEPRRGRSRVVLAAAALQTLGILLFSILGWLGLPVEAQLALLALACGVFFFITSTARFGPPGAVIFVFACGAALVPAGSLAEIAARGLAAAAVGALAFAICAVTERLRHLPDGQDYPKETLRPLYDRMAATLKIVLGTGLALYAGHLAGVDHPVWAAMGTLVVLQGPNLHTNLSRALQRMAGTMLGAVVAWLVLVQGPSLPVLIATLFALQFATELVIGANYALGQIFLTPMALLMSQLGAPSSTGAEMAPERVLDTLLGACVAIVVAIALSTAAERRELTQGSS